MVQFSDMDSEQTSNIPLFLRRVGNSDKTCSSNTMKKLVFPVEGSEGGAKSICPEIKVSDLSCSYTVSDMVLMSPTGKNQVCTMGIHGSDANLLDDQRKTSAMTIPWSYPAFLQQNKVESRNSVHPKNESINKAFPFDEEEQLKVDDGRPIKGKTCHSRPYCLPCVSDKNSSSFLKVYPRREGSLGSTSDSDSSHNSTPSGFFKSPFHYSGSSSSCGSISDLSTNTSPGISPSGDLQELIWFDDPFSVSRVRKDIKSKCPLTPDTPSISIGDQLHRLNLCDNTSPTKLPDYMALTPIEIEAKQRYEQRVRRKQERERKKEERFFF